MMADVTNQGRSSYRPEHPPKTRQKMTLLLQTCALRAANEEDGQ